MKHHETHGLTVLDRGLRRDLAESPGDVPLADNDSGGIDVVLASNGILRHPGPASP
jgi:hypothetical protein